MRNISVKNEEDCHEIEAQKLRSIGTFKESRIKILSGKGGGVYGSRKAEA